MMSRRIAEGMLGEEAGQEDGTELRLPTVQPIYSEAFLKERS